MNVHFRFRFVFGRKWNFIFVDIYSFTAENEKCFSVILYHKKVLVLIYNWLGLVLVLKEF